MYNMRIKYLLLILGTALLGTGCVYFNTFYNARKAFNEAEQARKESFSKGRQVIQKNRYEAAIDKALKVIENYPNSGWYDDALFVLGVSYFYTDQQNKSERRLRELLASYPNSKFADDAKLYLAKSKLKQNDIEEASVLLEEIFQGKFKKEYKTEAALSLGQYHFDKKEFDLAEKYFTSVRDSLGSAVEKREAQQFLADGLFERFKFQEALDAYSKELDMSPDKDEKYHAVYRSATCCYRLQKIDNGMNYLNELIIDEIYFDSLGTLKLQLAEGYELDGDLVQAENYYSEVANESKNNIHVTEANYRLGLIYQFDYDNLTKAKEYYDKAAKTNRSTPSGLDAFQRSTDIGKLDEFNKHVTLDSTATQKTIDDAASRQYELAELYWFNLDKPDSAIKEMQYLIETFPTAYDAPKALIALSSMVRDYEGDSTKADSILHEAISKYPNSDYVHQAAEALNLQGTPVDSGYPAYYLKKAEDYLIDKQMIDSAKYFYQYLADSFPDSKYYLQARFALVWIEETYQSPGDSSIYYAYQELVDSFPGTEWASAARQRINYKPSAHGPGTPTGEASDTTAQLAGNGENDAAESDTSTSSGITEKLQSIYVGPSGDTLPLFSAKPVQVLEPFIYPTEAYYLEWRGDLYFQIKLDFSGEVQDYKMMTKSASPELDRRAEAAVKSMRFDQLDVSKIVAELELKQAAEGGGYWFVFKYRVLLPEHLR